MIAGELSERWGLLLICTVVGLFGGAIRVANRKEPIASPVGDVCKSAAVSAFAAFVLCAILLDVWTTTRHFALIGISGVAGWTGAVVLDLLSVGLVALMNRRIKKLTDGPTPAAEPVERSEEPKGPLV
jgi:hypothetical protein